MENFGSFISGLYVSEDAQKVNHFRKVTPNCFQIGVVADLLYILQIHKWKICIINLQMEEVFTENRCSIHISDLNAKSIIVYHFVYCDDVTKCYDVNNRLIINKRNTPNTKWY